MSTEITEKKQQTAASVFAQNNVRAKFEKLLGEKAQGFISSVLQTVNNNDLLKKANPASVLNAAATAATLDIPINQNLGFAWIVPYKGEAQFQMGWRGYVQLALRTGQYKNINVVKVHENQFNSFNRLTEELDADFDKVGEGNVSGYAAFFKLLNGMEKTVFWSKDEVIAHAKKYSQSYKSKYSPWQDKDQFDAMAMKTVLKNMLSKWGIMSIEMQTAQLSDQAIVKGEGDYDYADNNSIIDIDASSQEEEENRIASFIDKAQTIEELDEIEEHLENDEQTSLFDKKKEEIEKKKS